MKSLIKDLSLYIFFLIAGAVMANVAVHNKTATALTEVAQACNVKVVDAQIKQGEAAEYAYNVGKAEIATVIIQACGTIGKLELVSGVLYCEIVPTGATRKDVI